MQLSGYYFLQYQSLSIKSLHMYQIFDKLGGINSSNLNLVKLAFIINV